MAEAGGTQREGLLAGAGRAALRVVAGYAVVATAWIVLSDRLAFTFAADPAALAALGISKGLLFVAVTSLLLFLEIRQLLRRLRSSAEQLDEDERRLAEALESSLRVIGNICESRDPYTAGHQRRVTAIAVAIAGELGLAADAVETVRMASLVHDVGKMSVPAELLSKPSVLTDTEFCLIREHALRGFEILSQAGMPVPLCEAVLQHHERLDGSGYPYGVAGEAIGPAARVLMVADVLEAMSSHRPYRPAKGLDAALEEIGRGEGTLYDAEAVRAARRLHERGGLAVAG